MNPAARTEYIVACIREAGSMYPDDAAAFLAEHDAHRRSEALTEAAAKLGRLADTVDARVASHYGPGLGSGIGPGSADMIREAGRALLDMAKKEDTSGATAGESTQPDPTPLVVRWDRTVIHPDADPTEPTIVCCLAADTGQPVALFLDDEHREALGLTLVDPNGDDDQEDAAPAELLNLATVLEIPRPNTGIPLQLRLSHGHADRWAICDRTGRRWYRDLGWMYEPDDDRLCDDGRFPLAEAVPLAREIAATEGGA